MLYCTLLAAAQSDHEREDIESRMKSEPELYEILHQLLEGESEEVTQVSKFEFVCRIKVASYDYLL